MSGSSARRPLSLESIHSWWYRATILAHGEIRHIELSVHTRDFAAGKTQKLCVYIYSEPLLTHVVVFVGEVLGRHQLLDKCRLTDALAAEHQNLVDDGRLRLLFRNRARRDVTA